MVNRRISPADVVAAIDPTADLLRCLLEPIDPEIRGFMILSPEAAGSRLEGVGPASYGSHVSG